MFSRAILKEYLSSKENIDDHLKKFRDIQDEEETLLIKDIQRLRYDEKTQMEDALKQY